MRTARRGKRIVRALGRAVIVLLLQACCLFDSSNSALAASSEKVTVFTQKHSLLGPIELSVGKSGVRIDVKQQRCVVVGRSPGWLMVFYNPKVKIKLERTIKQLKINPLFDLRPPKPNFRNINVHATRFNRLDTSLMTADVDFAIEDEFFFQRDEKPRKVKKVYYFSYLDRAKEFDQAALRFIEAVFGMRDGSGIPIAARYQFEDGQKASFVETQSKTIKTVDPNNFFATPVGFKKAKSELEVSSEKRTDLMDDWARDMLD